MLASVVADHMTASCHAVGRRLLVPTARELMQEHRLPCVPVVDGRRLVGLIAERELGAVASFADAAEMTVEEIMSPPPYVVAAGAPLVSVAADMAELRVATAVVVRAHRVVGIFTAADAVRALASMLARNRDGAPIP